ncbi:trypsin-like peptidase domain-containing protein [Actinophytocola sp. NPDC049390]|uniref:S1C family serine protease n=1 Tax=Actinophytocola sp. NPDC049390 TaxID=3363894 RepID=UPI0037BCCE75
MSEDNRPAAGQPDGPADEGTRSEWAAPDSPATQGKAGGEEPVEQAPVAAPDASGSADGTPGQQAAQSSGWAAPQQSEWARPSYPAAPAPQQGQWGAPANPPTREQVLFGSAVGAPTPPTGNYLPNPNPPSRPQRDVPPRQERRGSGALVAGVAALALLVGGGAGAVGGYVVADNTASAPVANALDEKPPAQQTSAAPAGSVEAVAEKVLPSVVQLQVRGRSSAGEGSGFVISSDGLIVTNNHVVESAADGGRIEAVFQDGTTATASIVGRDPTSDVAVVKAEGRTDLPVVELGSSDALKVGQGVVAIGSPFELSGTVTSGIVSSLHRPTRAGGEDGSQATVLDAIQTDAAINPGNSGGPLVNMQGQIVGINSAIYSPRAANGQAGSVGIGFAIPIDQARRTVKEIAETGKATQTVLGVSVRDGEDGGALIADVVAGGAGEKAGLKPGDVVTKLNDRRIDSSDALVAAVRSHAPGDKVRLELDNGSRTVEATLAGQTVEPQ